MSDKGSPSALGIQEILDELATQSDRGIALIVAAWADDTLADLLKRRFLDHAPSNRDGTPSKAEKNATFSANFFGNNGPLSTFSARIKMAYMLGLIGPEAFHDLDTIREIRNNFAHFRTRLDFTDQSIAAKCKNLTTCNHFYETNPFGDQSPRGRYVITGLCIAYYYIEYQVQRFKPATDSGMAFFVSSYAERASKSTIAKQLDSMIDENEAKGGEAT